MTFWLDLIKYDYNAAEPHDHNIDATEQVGPGKCFPGAPWCEFRGKKIPAVVGITQKGSMTSEILAKAIDKLDELDVYPRVPGGPIPCLLLDAHDTRLQIPFLERANRKIHGRPAWMPSIGLPQATCL